MEEKRIERRRRVEAPPPQPRSSPVNVLILVVIGVLGVLAATTAMLGTGFDDRTPHGRVLGDLQRVAEAQEVHHRRHARFAEWSETLALQATEGVRVTVTRGDARSWEAIASHEVGLTCIQTGRLDARGRPVRERPICYTNSGE